MLTRAGGLVTFSFILAPATSLIAQVLKVHLDLLAVLFYQGVTCVREDTVGVPEYPDVPRAPSTLVAHTLAFKAKMSEPGWGKRLSWTPMGEDNACHR